MKLSTLFASASMALVAQPAWAQLKLPRNEDGSGKISKRRMLQQQNLSMSSNYSFEDSNNDASGDKQADNKKGKGRTSIKASKEHLEQFYINEFLSTGEEVIIFESGPISIKAACGRTPTGANVGCSSNGEVCMILKLEYDEDILVFGDLAADYGLDDPPINYYTHVLAAGAVYTDGMWLQSRSGNDVDDGAVWTSTGHYIGWDGDSMIGVQSDGDLDIVGGNCIIAGVFHYVIPNLKPVKSAKGAKSVKVD